MKKGAPYERSVLQIERRGVLLLKARVEVVPGHLLDVNRQIHRRMHGLRRAVGGKGGAKRLVPVHDKLRGRFEGLHVDRAGQVQGNGLVVDAVGALLHLRCGPDLALPVGEREVLPGRRNRHTRHAVSGNRQVGLGGRIGVQHARGDHLVETLARGLDEAVEVGVAVGGRYEVIPLIPHVHPFQPHVVEEQLGERVTRRRLNPEKRRETHDIEVDAPFRKQPRQACGEGLGACIQAPL